MSEQPVRVETVIVGAGQCGLATGYYLKRRNADFVILDEHNRVGDMWRRRYDSLRLYTPARYDGLPGMAFPTDSGEFPTGVADGRLPRAVRSNISTCPSVGAKVSRMLDPSTARIGRFSGHRGRPAPTSRKTSWSPSAASECRRFRPFAGQLDPEIRQFHSDDYRNPRTTARRQRPDCWRQPLRGGPRHGVCAGSPHLAVRTRSRATPRPARTVVATRVLRPALVVCRQPRTHDAYAHRARRCEPEIRTTGTAPSLPTRRPRAA